MNNIKKEKLDPVLYEKMEAEYRRPTSELVKFQQTISERGNYIVRKIAKEFGVDLNWWDFQEETSGFEFPSEEYVGFTGEAGKKWFGNTSAIIDKEGNEIGLADCFPKRWLWEDFEDELTQGKEKFIEQEKKTKERLKLAKQLDEDKNRKLRKEARAKLNSKERKALGL